MRSNESFYINVRSSIIHNNQIVKMTKRLLTNKCINKMWYSYSTKSCLVIKRNEVLTNAIVQLLSRVRFFVTPWTTALQASLSFIISQSLLKLMSTELGCHPNISSSVVPFFSCLQSFSASVFSNELALLIRWSKYWKLQLQHLHPSFGILPINIQD